MDQTLIERYLVRLDGLVRDGRALRDLVGANGSDASATATDRVRSWQQACAATVNELSGGSKSHWLARTFSEAYLVRSIGGEAAREVALAEIVDRLIGVLETAGRSLAQAATDAGASPSAASRPRRFGFVHNAALRPILEQAYVEARAALDGAQHAVCLTTACGILDALLTDALEHAGSNSPEWPFSKRIEVAEEKGLIRGGCARLPPIARDYRELSDREGALAEHTTVSAREAQTALQVLQVVMRDLDPGR
jgi:hypothetical protein